jgi:hypothetical protein
MTNARPIRAALVAVVALVALAFSAGTAAAGSGQAWGYDSTGDGNPDVRGVFAGWDENNWLLFGTAIHRSVLFAGEDVGVFIDVDGRMGSEYQLRLHQYGDGTTGTSLLYASGGNWTYRTGTTAAGGWISGNMVYVYVHASEIGWPQGGVNFVAYSLGGRYASAYDLVPNTGYWNLPASTQVGGARGPGVDQAPADPPTDLPETGGSPETNTGDAPAGDDSGATPETPVTATETPVTPAVSASKAKQAIAQRVRKRVPAHAKLKLTGCKRSGATRYRCNVKATRRGHVWRGKATARLLASGGYAVEVSLRRRG